MNGCIEYTLIKKRPPEHYRRKEIISFHSEKILALQQMIADCQTAITQSKNKIKSIRYYQTILDSSGCSEEETEEEEESTTTTPVGTENTTPVGTENTTPVGTENTTPVGTESTESESDSDCGLYLISPSTMKKMYPAL